MKSSVDWLKQDPRIDAQNMYLLGYSRGAEAVLNLASLDARLAGTVAVAPTCMRFQGFVSYTVPFARSAGIQASMFFGSSSALR